MSSMDGIAPRRVSRRRLLQSAVTGLGSAAALAALASCGVSRASGASTTTTTFSDEVTAQQVPVVADPDGLLRWTAPEYRARAGAVTFVVSNPSALAHNFGVVGAGVNAHSRDIATGEIRYCTLWNLAAGSYQITCTFPGHHQAGMVARLTVSE